MTAGRPAPHPDRVARTLAERERLLAERPAGPFQQPGPGSADARLDLKLLRHAAEQALAARGTDAARARLAGLDGADLRAGTVQDGTARGLAVAYEEAISLCRPAPPPLPPAGDADARVAIGAELRRRKDLLVASGGSRIRFSRKRGVHFIGRDQGLNLEDCIWFEDRRDAGTLDAFAAVPDERPRLFRPAFLTPTLYSETKAETELRLEGTLGRGDWSQRCRITCVGRRDEPRVRLRVAVDNRLDDHRLRIRFWNFPPPAREVSATVPALERIEVGGRWFWATTLVRACGRLSVGDSLVPVPSAQCHGWIEHEFELWAEP
jgi:hypothetical protein